jgi:23S rRNA (guanine745-N1)-methyltransferase
VRVPTAAPLACTVRGCGRPLARSARALTCEASHSFDIARTGYVNLLQPQDRKSTTAGDTKAVVDARAALLASGVGMTLLNDVVQQVLRLDLRDEAVVVDLGSGSGDALAILAMRRPIVGVGIDLSVPAIEHAARHFPGPSWIVANADRRLPLLDASVDLVMSINGRRNPAECARVLAPEGLLVIAQPAPDDLIELRGAVQGHTRELERPQSIALEHQPHFSVVDHTVVREQRLLDSEQLRRVLATTYRAARKSAAGRMDTLKPMEVTFSANVYVLRAESGGLG